MSRAKGSWRPGTEAIVAGLVASPPDSFPALATALYDTRFTGQVTLHFRAGLPQRAEFLPESVIISLTGDPVPPHNPD